MAAGLLVVVVVLIPLVLVVPLVVGLLAWVLLRPAEGEPEARAALRRASGTTAASATAAGAVLLVVVALLGLQAPELAALGVLLAGLVHVVVLWCGDALTARPHAARRTALLDEEPRRSRRTALTVLLGAALAGLLVLTAVGALGLPVGPGLEVPPMTSLLLCVPAVALAALVALAVRQVGRRGSDARLHPEVEVAGRARATHRLLRGGASATCAALGLPLLVVAQDGDRPGGPAVVVVLVLGAVLLLLGAVVSLLPPPGLPLRPDAGPDAAVASAARTGAA